MKTQMEIDDTQVQVGLDRFVLAMPYPKLLQAELSQQLTLEQIEQHITEKAEFVAGMHFIKNIVVDSFKYHLAPSKNKDIKRYNVFFDDGGLMFILSVGFCFGTGVLNIEVNPSKLNQKQWQELTNWLDVLINKGYEEFYTKAVVSHAEFFVDVSEEDISSLVLIDDTRRTSTPYEGNTYLGKRESPRVSFMYDKAKQLELDEKLVRVEARINPKSLRLQDLVEGNQISPFGNDLVVNINQLQSISIAHGKAQFATRIKEFGLNGSGINKYSRKSIYAQLQKNAVSWWKPELFWSIHKEQLQEFKLLGKL